MRVWLKNRAVFWREVLWRPLARAVLGVWVLFSTAVTIRDNFLSHQLQERLNTLRLIRVVPKFDWKGWVVATLAILLVVTLEGSYRAFRKKEIDANTALQAANEEIARLSTQRFSEDRMGTAREQLAKLATFERETLRQLLIRGEMLESHATEYVDSRNLGRFSGILNSIQAKTSFVNHDSTGQYRLNPAFREVLEELLAHDAP